MRKKREKQRGGKLLYNAGSIEFIKLSLLVARIEFIRVIIKN